MKRDRKKEDKISDEIFFTIRALLGLSRGFVKKIDPQNFAFSCIMKGDKSQAKYIEDRYWAENAIMTLLENSTLRTSMENRYEIKAPISSSFRKTSAIVSTVPNFMLMILCISFFLAYIVTN
mmetsp:Transcript_11015/g.16713  ORF Transcript_11015/g.16713 Transcript_11015/m.16713 type:complete len:122 (+) Transcript_11015:2045-2410(+)